MSRAWTVYDGSVEARVELFWREDGVLEARIGERVYLLEARRTATGHWSLLGAHGVREISIDHGDGERWKVSSGKARLTAEVMRPGQAALRRDRQTMAGDGSVVAPMSGKVVAVEVAPGQSVQRGDPLVVVEAMKMENVLVSTVDGVVNSLFVEVGMSVEVGKVLVVVAE